MKFSLNNHEVHLWHILPGENLLSLLSPDEVARAERFRFERDRDSYVRARGGLRRVLAGYFGGLSQEIVFSYSEHGKPFINNALNLQFNLSHSGERAVCAVTRGQDIGVDIEKIRDEYDDAVARRFFSEWEYQQLLNLPDDARLRGFFQIWSRKEAIIKTIGAGLFVPLSDFSVSVSDKEQAEIVLLQYEKQQYQLHVTSFFAEAGYAAAVATSHAIKSIQHAVLL